MSGEKDGGSISLEDYDYELPPELIAQHPPPRRADSRLWVLDRAREELEHRSFRELPGYLRDGDILVLNETLVLPGRLRARKQSGGKVEVLLLEPVADRRWQVLLKPGKAFAEGRSLALEKDPGTSISCHERRGQTFIVSFSAAGDTLGEEDVRLLSRRIGEIPLPPYISREQPSREAP
ncbi:MAG: S-adenosylmethionine:tRNA ribosyltransferase-isomerase, partial [Planctomycetes bacterium]|nr:S-adenosylmethionine:tRNA ribosyltransferase-isomerase [Planctomycetota bacterium]